MTVQRGETDTLANDGHTYGKFNGNLRLIGNPETLSSSKTSLHSNGSVEKIHVNGYTSTESITEVEVKTIALKLKPFDRRFGFSVVGGSDAGFPARIDEISEDSPADRSDLQIDDEILEVNGMPVADATHADVIMQIHKCFQKKAITLKIRRYFDDDVDNAVDPGPISNQGYTHERSIDVEIERDSDRRHVNGTGGLASFVNPAFDKDDIADEHLDSSMARPNANRPGTLPIPSFIALVEHLKNKLLKSSEQDDIKFLRNLFISDEYQWAIKAHNKMTRIQESQRTLSEFKPVATNSQFLVSEVRHILMGLSGSLDAEELLGIISKPTFQSFLLAHDRLAMRESFNSVSGDDVSSDGDGHEFLDDYSGYDQRTEKVVQIDKTNDPLGATVKNEGDAVIISRIIKGGAAEKSGLLHEGDEILEINRNPVRGKSVNEVVEILREIEGTLEFLLLPGESYRRSPTRENSIFFRAQFDYEPQDDNYMPCRELGLAFRKGDILEVVNQDDPNWWQARKVDTEERGLAGMIPSKAFQQQRGSTRVTGREVKEPETTKQKKRCFCLPGRKKKAKTIENSQENDFSIDEILTYEQMVEVQPNTDKKRPIILVGPPKVGRRELREKLIKYESSRFAPAVPHTSRPPKIGDVDGKDFFFISQTEFKSDINAHKFVEYGQFENEFFGTSINAIRDVIKKNRVCVLNLHCQALPVLKNTDLRPYVIFVTLPSFDQLRRLRGTTGEPFNPNVRLQDDELMDLIERAREMDINYGHYFDHQIINQNFEKAFDELLQVANFIETQPQWVPVSWTN